LLLRRLVDTGRSLAADAAVFSSAGFSFAAEEVEAAGVVGEFVGEVAV